MSTNTLMHLRLPGLFAIAFFLLAALAHSGEPLVVRATGDYVMGDGDTREKGRERALYEAKRNALEAAGTQLASTTTVEDFVVVSDVTRAESAGLLRTRILEESYESVGMAGTESGEASGGIATRAVVSIEATVYPLTHSLPARVADETAPAPADASADSFGPQGLAAAMEAEAAAAGAAESRELALIRKQAGTTRELLPLLARLNKLEHAYPRSPRVRLHKAWVLKQLGRTRAAAQEVRAACRLGSAFACDVLRAASYRQR